MNTAILDFFSYNFILYALGSGMCLGIACAFLGPFLVLKNLSLIGDGLSHVAFFAMTIGLILGKFPLIITIAVVVASSLFILKISEGDGVDGDSAIGMISSAALALGVILINLSTGFNVDVFSFLFGSILFTGNEELFLSFLCALFTVCWVYYYYYDLLSTIYDEEYTASQGLNTERIKKMLFILTGAVIAVGMRIVGALLVSSLIIFPAISALQISKTLKGTIAAACIFSSISIFLGVLGSYLFNLPTGAAIVAANVFFFILALFLK